MCYAKNSWFSEQILLRGERLNDYFCVAKYLNEPLIIFIEYYKIILSQKINETPWNVQHLPTDVIDTFPLINPLITQNIKLIKIMNPKIDHISQIRNIHCNFDNHFDIDMYK